MKMKLSIGFKSYQGSKFSTCYFSEWFIKQSMLYVGERYMLMLASCLLLSNISFYPLYLVKYNGWRIRMTPLKEGGITMMMMNSGYLFTSHNIHYCLSHLKNCGGSPIQLRHTTQANNCHFKKIQDNYMSNRYIIRVVQ